MFLQPWPQLKLNVIASNCPTIGNQINNSTWVLPMGSNWAIVSRNPSHGQIIKIEKVYGVPSNYTRWKIYKSEKGNKTRIVIAHRLEMIQNKQVLVRMWRKGNTFALLVGMQTGAATMESSMGIPQKVKNGSVFWPSDPTSGNVSEGTQNTNSKEHKHSYVHCSII